MQHAMPMRISWLQRGDDTVGRMVPDAAPRAEHERDGTQRQQRTASDRDTPPVPIIAFSKDWNGDHTSNHHVLRELAKTRRVVWLNSVGTRQPSLASARDLKTIKRKLTEVTRGPVRVENDLWVATPLALPMAERPSMKAVNRWLVEGFVRAIRRRLGIDRFQLWTFLPNVADYLSMGEELSVYYCVDEWSLFEYLERDTIVAAERELLQRVDAVFAVNHALADAKRELCPTTFVAPHGVDHALFAKALAPETVVPEDLARLPKPRIGFYGTLREWVDFDLIATIARARPKWSIVLIGQQLADVSALTGLPNVHLLGPRPHAELPAYCAGFDVGIIPYRAEQRMEFVNPLKLREYLAAGLPVVSTPITEVERYPGLCQVAREPASFIGAIERALRIDSRAARLARSAAMRDETWESRVECVARRVDEVAERGIR
jgi:glycosyltransferase involved in cell wall biosynthesis